MSGLRRRPPGDRTSERGQGLVEFAIIVPVFMLLLLGMLEFGFIFDQTMQISYATREGARSGSAFASGNSTTMICNTTVDVDKNIIAAVQRVLKAPGSRVVPSQIQEIRIFRSDANGDRPGTSTTGPTAPAPVRPLTVPGSISSRGRPPGTPAPGRTGSTPTRSGSPSSTRTGSRRPWRSWIGSDAGAIGDQTRHGAQPDQQVR